MAHTRALSVRPFLAFAIYSCVVSSIPACGGGGGGNPGGPSPQPQTAVIQVTAPPSPVALTVCPPERCGSSAPEFEVLTTLTVRETGGVAGRVDSIGVTLRRSSDNVTILSTTISAASVQVRFPANGSVEVPFAIHHVQSDVTGPTAAALVLNATADGGRAVTANVTVPVAGPPTRSGLFITGNYRIEQAAVSTSCGDTAAPPTVTGWVTLTGPDSFQLADTGGTTFSGTVQGDGSLVATAVFGPDAGGQTFTQRLEGSFGGSGFTARLSVTVQPRNCAFTRNWTASRI